MKDLRQDGTCLKAELVIQSDEDDYKHLALTLIPWACLELLPKILDNGDLEREYDVAFSADEAINLAMNWIHENSSREIDGYEHDGLKRKYKADLAAEVYVCGSVAQDIINKYYTLT